jgi:hypothetical protein
MVLLLEPKKTRTVRVNFRCWPTVGITTIYSFVTPNKPHHTEEPPPNYTQNTNKMSCQTHFSTMAAAVVPWPPWCPPDFAEHRKNCQYHRPSFMPVEGMVGRDGMPLRYRRTPWFELLEVVSECRYFFFSSYKIYVGINLISAGICRSASYFRL